MCALCAQEAPSPSGRGRGVRGAHRPTCACPLRSTTPLTAFAAREASRRRSAILGAVTGLWRALLLASTLLLLSSLPAPGSLGSATAQTAVGGRVLAPARGQVAWLDLLAPRPTPLTQL